ncbi:MAG: competence protein ComK [Amphibacillus sp.]|uniref:Competence transcription factor ComK n=1 Tax=Amphibacillus xylanus (strain ATCC 51415 / DSM 6626 / JCM 7361 / LMG 17667 / NBRC 15112 / Ep01) TaxID=698758 RepID=K0IWZ8_AMPXN|nr:competence protein ComK [Amphibacillus xylanus]NMA90205.1 competence protein ComK [Amphibacillus sp.]BAM46914.1 competence transcription factor ComK [Amphibacillus xylanus NBRC 15112]
MNLKERTSYELSQATMALIATEIDGLWGSIVYEEGASKPIYVAEPPTKIIEKAHKQNGEELLARADAAKVVCGFNNKPPVVISITKNLYYFPTHSPSNPNCSWFSHTHSTTVSKAKYGGAIVHFRNGHKLEIPVSEMIMTNQLYRTAQFRFMIDQQIQPLQKKKALETLLKALFDEELNLD